MPVIITLTNKTMNHAAQRKAIIIAPAFSVDFNHFVIHNVAGKHRLGYWHDGYLDLLPSMAERYGIHKGPWTEVKVEEDHQATVRDPA